MGVPSFVGFFNVNVNETVIGFDITHTICTSTYVSLDLINNLQVLVFNTEVFDHVEDSSNGSGFVGLCWAWLYWELAAVKESFCHTPVCQYEGHGNMPDLTNESHTTPAVIEVVITAGMVGKFVLV